MKRLAGLTALALIITGTGGCSWAGLRPRGSGYPSARPTAALPAADGVQYNPPGPPPPHPPHTPPPAARG